MEKQIWQISLFQKYLMGFTGLGLAFFVLVHMLGNLLIFAGAKAYNLYAHKLEQSWVVVFEMGLFLMFSLHIILAVFLTLKNRKARPKKSHCEPTGEKATSFYQKSLIAQGMIIFIFVILHLIAFKFGTYYETLYEGKAVRDIFRLVVEAFKNPLTVFWYILALLILSFHLFHGVSSSFQSLGLEFSGSQAWLKKVSFAYTVFVTIGYISIPLYVFFFVKGGAH